MNRTRHEALAVVRSASPVLNSSLAQTSHRTRPHASIVRPLCASAVSADAQMAGALPPAASQIIALPAARPLSHAIVRLAMGITTFPLPTVPTPDSIVARQDVRLASAPSLHVMSLALRSLAWRKLLLIPYN